MRVSRIEILQTKRPALVDAKSLGHARSVFTHFHGRHLITRDEPESGRRDVAPPRLQSRRRNTSPSGVLRLVQGASSAGVRDAAMPRLYGRVFLEPDSCSFSHGSRSMTGMLRAGNRTSSDEVAAATPVPGKAKVFSILATVTFVAIVPMFWFGNVSGHDFE